MKHDLSQRGKLLRTLREGARLSIPRASAWLGVSVGHMWNCEQGLSTFTAEQETALQTFYGERIAEQLSALNHSLENLGN